MNYVVKCVVLLEKKTIQIKKNRKKFHDNLIENKLTFMILTYCLFKTQTIARLKLSQV